jgi:uncharacterized phage-associated protein
MRTRLNALKAVQAAAALLRFETGWKMGRMRLLKLLYLADRECLRRTGLPLIGDRTVAMDRGPLHGTIYDWIKGKGLHEKEWSKFIRSSGPREICLHTDPGNGKLSKHEIDILLEISRKFLTWEDDELSEMTHDLPEYIKANKERPPASSRPIPIEDIIDAVSREEDKESILQDLADKAAYERVFGD